MMKTVAITRACPNCNEEVTTLISKRQLKAMLKAMKQATPAQAELMAEKIIGRDSKTGDLKW